MLQRFALVFLLVAALTGLRPIAAQNPPDTPPASSRTLVGAWTVDITPNLAPPFTSLGTFSADGTLTNISSPSLGSPLESPGYGEWVRVGTHSFALTFHTLIGDGAGNLGATGKVRATLTVGPKGDELTGVFQVDIFDPAGGLIVSDTGTVQGRRLRVEPLP